MNPFRGILFFGGLLFVISGLLFFNYGINMKDAKGVAIGLLFICFGSIPIVVTFPEEVANRFPQGRTGVSESFRYSLF